MATTEKYIEPFAKKGSRVLLQGHVENDSWTGKTGVEHYDLRGIVADIRLKNRRDRSDEESYLDRPRKTAVDGQGERPLTPTCPVLSVIGRPIELHGMSFDMWLGMRRKSRRIPCDSRQRARQGLALKTICHG